MGQHRAAGVRGPDTGQLGRAGYGEPGVVRQSASMTGLGPWKSGGKPSGGTVPRTNPAR